jgi:rhamnogalacturonan endolyase
MRPDSVLWWLGKIAGRASDCLGWRGHARRCAPGWIVAVGSMLAATVAAAQPAGPVTVDRRGREFVLANGIVTVSVDGSDAEITAIGYRGHDMVSRTGRHRNVYFSRDGGGDYEKLSHCTATVASQTPDGVDLRCSHVYAPAAGDKHAWDVDVHFVLRRGVSGPYVYAVCHHPASYPDMSVGEWRMVWSTPDDANDFLATICVDPARHWTVPAPADFARGQPVEGAPKEVTRLTTGAWAGKLDCKYEYAAPYWGLDCWGFADDAKRLGAFVVLPSHEFFNDGPFKQDLTAAVGTTLLHLNMNHYDGTGFRIRQGQAWTKCYGPWLLYVNNGANADACWADAQARGRAEAAVWPYPWVSDPAYPAAAARGDVRGRLVVHDPLKPDLTAANAWVGLAPAADADFQFSATGYQFWTHAAADGSFELPHVRPGDYTLYAVVDGVVGQFARAGVTVAAGELPLGTVTWDVPHPGRRIAWEIGTPDRSAAEFAHGRDYFQPLLYQQLWTQTPNPLEFTVGRSNPARDWPYAQTVHKDNGRAVTAKWRIHFTLDRAPAGASTLVLAFAGADRGRVAVYANGESAADRVAEVTPPVEGGNGLVREAVHTKYSVATVPIPTGRLRAGANTITLEQQSTGDASYVMYDAVRLELP